MNNSIQQFMDKGTVLIEKIIKNFISDEKMDIGEFVLELNKPLQELQRNIVAETIETMDETLRNSSYRKKKYFIQDSGLENSFLSTCGQITYKRTYFKSKETGEFVFLADQACGITCNMRKSDDVVAAGIQNAVESSYRISGEKATATEDIVSKQAIMKDLHELEIPEFIPKVKEKKKVKILYINADEDHASLQFNKTKGDLKRNTYGKKINTIEPKLACIFEGIENESINSKRKRTYNKHIVSDVYKKSEDIWIKILEYIDAVYDEEYIERIYIMGDGASWIKTGVDVLGAKSFFVLDKFHLNQSIMRAIGHLGDSVSDVRAAIYESIRTEDLKEIDNILKIASSYAESESKKEQVRKTRVYIKNNWEAIILPNTDEAARVGCSAEGQVSHILSARLSTRPLGWSRHGVKQMAKLRAYSANGGNIYDLIKYKKEKQTRIIHESIKEEAERKIKKKQKAITDVWNHSILSGKEGQINGMYFLSKKLRGICG